MNAAQTGKTAVIGMAGRFPGTHAVDQLWDNLKNPDNVEMPGYPGDTETFDSAFFGYTLGQAVKMAPWLRIYHECAWAAVEDAGYNPEACPGKVRVYAGVGPGMDRAAFDLFKWKLITCPGFTAAVQMACRALQNRECEMALAGGPLGGGMVVLKPLEKALEQGDHIYAVIKGTGLEPWEQKVPPTDGHRDRNYRLILLSARTPSALEKMTENLVHYFKKNPVNPVNPVKPVLSDAAYTLQAGRKRFKYRAFTVCSPVDEAITHLSSPGEGEMPSFYSPEENTRVVFMFPGLGSQYVNMALQLYETEPIFRETMDTCFEIFQQLMGYDLKEIVYPENLVSKVSKVSRVSRGEFTSAVKDSSHSPDSPQSPYSPHSPKNSGDRQNLINQMEISQPLVFIIEYALAQLLMEWGIRPCAMIGHSLGEYTAACLAGVFSPEDALALVALREKLMQRSLPGAMLSVGISEAELVPRLNENRELSLAAVNAASGCVISGPRGAVEAFAAQMEEKGYDTRLLHISYAGHSHMMDPILGAFEEKVKQIPLDKPQIPYLSSLTGQWITAAEAVEPRYWVNHLRRPVRFFDGLTELLKKEENAALVEVGPGSVLSTLARQHPDQKSGHSFINLVRHPKEDIADDRFLLHRIGQLWQMGVTIDWAGYYKKEKRQRVPLPTYPFEGQSFAAEQPLQENEPQVEIETHILEHKEIEKAVVISKVAETGDSYLCAYYVPVGPDIPGQEELDGYLSRFLPDYLLPRYYLALEAIPLTADGEVDPGALPSPETAAAAGQYIAPGDEIEETLAGIWAEVLAMDKGKIGIDDNFFRLGGQSIKATMLISRIHRRFNVRLSMSEFFEVPTIGKLARCVKTAESSRFIAVEPVEKKEYYPLSSAQKRIYVIQQLNPGSITYNIKLTVTLQGMLEETRLENAFRELINRHESLRTSFLPVGGLTVQGIHEQVEFNIEYHDDVNAIKNFVRPFDLSHAPLLRVGLIKTGSETRVLIMDMHHVISDGRSLEIFLTGLLALYRGETLPEPGLQYKDFSQWQDKLIRSGELKKQEEYWLNLLSGDIPVLKIPTDYPRPEIKSNKGSTIEFEIGGEVADGLRSLARREGTTLYMVILTIFNILLFKLGGQEDIMVGTLVAGRRHPDLENIIGMFVNTLLLRNRPGNTKGIIEFLREVKKGTLEAFDNQDYQFDDLVEKIGIPRDTSRNPLFDVLFLFSKLDPGTVTILDTTSAGDTGIPGLKIKPYRDEDTRAKFDILFTGRDTGERENLFFLIEYSTELFKRETIERFIENFKEVASAVIKDQSAALMDIVISHDLSLVVSDLQAETEFDF